MRAPFDLWYRVPYSSFVCKALVYGDDRASLWPGHDSPTSARTRVWKRWMEVRYVRRTTVEYGAKFWYSGWCTVIETESTLGCQTHKRSAAQRLPERAHASPDPLSLHHTALRTLTLPVLNDDSLFALLAATRFCSTSRRVCARPVYIPISPIE